MPGGHLVDRLSAKLTRRSRSASWDRWPPASTSASSGSARGSLALDGGRSCFNSLLLPGRSRPVLPCLLRLSGPSLRPPSPASGPEPVAQTLDLKGLHCDAVAQTVTYKDCIETETVIQTV